jgi:starvation-inducible DNA-binding protein
MEGGAGLRQNNLRSAWSQRVENMHKTRNDLAAKVRAKSIELLNARLAGAIDLYLQTKQAHWNVKGPSFIALHELFDKLGESLEGNIDDMAERIVALGGIAEGTLGAVSARTRLEPYPLDLSEGMAHVDALADAYAVLGKAVRKGIDDAGKAGDADTSDLLTGVSRELDKSLWLLEAHRQAQR